MPAQRRRGSYLLVILDESLILAVLFPLFHFLQDGDYVNFLLFTIDWLEELMVYGGVFVT